MPTFQKSTLGQMLSFYNGKAIKPGGEGQYPVYGSNGVIGGCDEFKYSDGIIVGRVGAYCGSVQYCPGKFWASDNTIVVKPQNADFNVRFLYYLLSDLNLNNYAGGAAQPLVTQSVLKQVEALSPPIKIQRKIASILSAYDDLIENNTRRISILEEMAQAIYREWFVNFRFPGHEKIRMVDSPLGRVPEGWEVKMLGDLCSLINRGISPTYDDTSTSTVINQKCIRDFRLNFEPSRKHSKKVPPEKYLQFGDVVVNSTGVGTLGRVAQVLKNLQDCTADSHVTIVRCKSAIDLHYFGLKLFELQDHLERLGQGATGQTELSRHSVSEIESVVADISLQRRFGQLVEPMRVLAVDLFDKNELLRQTRDLLLPKLISGEVEVSGLAV